MRTPGGWAMSHMLYDKLPGPPPPGSPLESVFLLVHLERTNSALLAHRALIQAVLPADKNQDPAIKAYEAYCDQLLPFMKRAEASENDDARAQLAEFVKKSAKIDLRPIYKARVDDAKRKAARRFKVQPQIPGRERHAKRHTLTASLNRKS